LALLIFTNRHENGVRNVKGDFEKSLLIALCFVVTLCWTSIGNAQTVAFGELENFEYVMSQSEVVPESGWQTAHMPFEDFFPAENAQTISKTSAWLKFPVPQSLLSTEPAVLIGDSSEKVWIYFNDKLIYKSFVNPDETNFASFLPRYALVPHEVIAPDKNELIVRVESNVYWTLSMSDLSVGDAGQLKKMFDRRYWTQYLGPLVVNGVLMFLTMGIFLFWLSRPREKVFGWLGLVGVTWIIRNFHHYLVWSPIDPYLLWELVINSTFVLLFAFTGFCVDFFKIKGSVWIMPGAALVMAGTIVGRYMLLAHEQSDLPAYVALIIATLVIACLFARQCWKAPKTENLLMFAAVILAFGFVYHDFGNILGVWIGTGFMLFPYASILVFGAFSYALGRRLLMAMHVEENMNSMLSQQVELATEKLTKSEQARYALELAGAITHERERMMREIHDGIGSSIVSALATAEHHGSTRASAIATLRSALTDLRIAVDSLDPAEGNISTLLASLRYRLEPDFEKAGLKFVWQVDEVPELSWVDPVNALHVLRILQEAFSNTLSHAKASKITVVCREEDLDSEPGVRIRVVDNGVGFDVMSRKRGKGLKNMVARAEALGAKFSIESNGRTGSATTIWLPLKR
jgi:signal transduction histidine kinase